MSDEATDKTVSPPERMLDVQWVIPHGPAIYVNQLLAQYDGDVVHLMFAQVGPPQVAGKTEEEIQRNLEKLSTVPAIPIGRFAVPVNSLRRMIEVLQQHLEKIDKCPKP
jgi:hypothetical protein